MSQFFNLFVYYTQLKAIVFSLKNTKTSYKKQLKIQLKKFSTLPFFWCNQGLILKVKVDIDDEKGTQISHKDRNTRVTLDYNYGVQKSCTLHLFFIFLLLCSYCYWYNKKTRIVFAGSFNFTYDWIWTHPNKCAQN